MGDNGNQNPESGSGADGGDGLSIESAYGGGAGGGNPAGGGGTGTESQAGETPKPGQSGGGETGPEDEKPKLAAWTEQLPDTLKGDQATAKRLAKFQKVEDLAKSYLELETKLGGAVTIPGKGASEEEKAAFRKRLGVPEDKGKYSFAKQPDAGVFVDVAFGAGLTDEQASAIYEANKAIVAEQMKARKQATKEQIANLDTALKAEYGAKFSEKVERMKRGLAVAGPEAAGALQSAGLAYHPGIVKAFIQLGESVAEPFAPRTGGSAGSRHKSVSEGGGLVYKH